MRFTDRNSPNRNTLWVRSGQINLARRCVQLLWETRLCGVVVDCRARRIDTVRRSGVSAKQFHDQRAFRLSDGVRVGIATATAFHVAAAIVIAAIDHSSVMQSNRFAEHHFRCLDSPHHMLGTSRWRPAVEWIGIKRETGHDHIGIAVIHDIDCPLCQSPRLVKLGVGRRERSRSDRRKVNSAFSQNHHQRVQVSGQQLTTVSCR